MGSSKGHLEIHTAKVSPSIALLEPDTCCKDSQAPKHLVLEPDSQATKCCNTNDKLGSESVWEFFFLQDGDVYIIVKVTF